MNYTKSSFLDDFELPEITHDNVKQKLLKVGTIQSVKRNSFDSMPLEERLKMVELKSLVIKSKEAPKEGVTLSFDKGINKIEYKDKYLFNFI